MPIYGPWLQYTHEVEILVVSDDADTLGETYASPAPNPTDSGIGYNMSMYAQAWRYDRSNGDPSAPSTTDSTLIGKAFANHRLGQGSAFADTGDPTPTPTGADGGDEIIPPINEDGHLLLVTEYHGAAPGIIADSVRYTTQQALFGFGVNGTIDTRVEPPGGDWPVGAIGVDYAPGSESAAFDYDDIEFTWGWTPGGGTGTDVDDDVTAYFERQDFVTPTDGYERLWKLDHANFQDASDILSTLYSNSPAMPILSSALAEFTTTFDAALIADIVDTKSIDAQFVLDGFIDADRISGDTGVTTVLRGGLLDLVKLNFTFRSAEYRFIMSGDAETISTIDTKRGGRVFIPMEPGDYNVYAATVNQTDDMSESTAPISVTVT